MLRRFLSSQLRINMASGVMMTVVNIAVLAVAYPLYLHFLGYEKYGVWLILAVVLSFAQLGNLGIGQAVMKLVAEDYGRDDIEGIGRYVTTAFALLCLSGTVALVVILALKDQIITAFKLTGHNAETVSWLLPYIGFLSIYVCMVQALNATLSGLGRMDLANYIQTGGRIVAVTVAVALLLNGRGIESLLIGSTLSYVWIHVISLICIRRIARIRLLRLDHFDVGRCKRLICFGGGVFGGSLAGMLLNPFNKLMLSRYAGVSTIPVYEIALRASMQVRALIESGLKALMPEISRISGNMAARAKGRISQINGRAMKLIFLFGIAMYGILVVLAPPLLKVWLGERFIESLPGVFRIMLTGTFLGLLGMPAYYTLMGMGHVRHTLGANIIRAILNWVTVLCILMASTVSVNAIAWSFAIAMAGATLYLVLQKKRIFQHIDNELYEIRKKNATMEAVTV